MSVIQERLEQRDFISLHDLLIKISESDGCTLGEAAAMLCQLLRANPEKAPGFTFYAPTHGVNRAKNQQMAMSLLDYVARNGDFEQDMSDEIPF